MKISTSVTVTLPITSDVIQTASGHFAMSSILVRDPVDLGAVPLPLSMLPASVQSAIISQLADEAQSMFADQSADKFNDWLLGANSSKAA